MKVSVGMTLAISIFGKLFNLFTGANKMSYIDSFLDRNVGCQQFVNDLYQAIGENKHHWFVS